MSDRKDNIVQITRKAPVSWLDLRSLLDVGLLAAISATADKRTPRREVLAALDIALGAAPYADYSDQTDPVWLDYVADLGDGFDATHSIAWLIGRDYLGIGPPGEAVAQPMPPNDHSECRPADFDAVQVLPGGKITIFGGDLVYPYASQTAYEDRTIGPYHAARPWQLTADGQSDGRHLFAIPGNHDWYDGLGAFVQRFCQPGRWMGAWQVQQRRSYFAIKLPHRVWVWGVDLATGNDFDAPQLEYFEARARDLGPGDLVILCVPAPAWLHRKGADRAKRRSWDPWSKIDKINKMVVEAAVKAEAAGQVKPAVKSKVATKSKAATAKEATAKEAPPRIAAILAGDLHHYARYETQAGETDPIHLITCGGGGAYLLGTGALPPEVQIGAQTGGMAVRKAAFPTPAQSAHLARAVINPAGNNWQLFGLLGAGLLALVWLLESRSTPSLLAAVWALVTGQGGLGGVGVAMLAVVSSSPWPLLLLAAVAAGFVSFAASDREAARWKIALAGLVHFKAQMVVVLIVAGLIIRPLIGESVTFWTLAWVTPLALALAWIGSATVFGLYLPAAHFLLGLHEEEVFSVRAHADWKGFLRIRVAATGITIYPIGLEKVCHGWSPARNPTVSQVAKPEGLLRQAVRGVARRMVEPSDSFTVPKGTTHLLRPDTPLSPQLIEPPIEICRNEAAP